MLLESFPHSRSLRLLGSALSCGEQLKVPATQHIGVRRWEELELVGERLRYRRLTGTGPDEGRGLGGNASAVRIRALAGQEPLSLQKAQVASQSTSYMVLLLHVAKRFDMSIGAPK